MRSKGSLDAASGHVRGVIASGGSRGPASAGPERRDRPLGKRGADILGQVPLFAGLSRRHLKQLAEHADQVAFLQGETIVRADEPGGSFFVILQGEVKVVRGAKTISRMGPGEFFGEISLLDGGPRTATVVAETPVLTARVFKRSFDRVVTQEPTVASKILAVVARRLRDAERTLSN